MFGARGWKLGVSLAVVFVIGGLVGAAVMKSARAQTVPLYVAAASSNAASQVSFQSGFAPVARKVLPSVVNISSSRIVHAPQSPMSDLFHQFFGQQFPEFRTPRRLRETALGSGVIVSGDGYVLTNDHVIQNATDIKVMLGNKREYTARLIGADRLSDLAVIKIDRSNLPVITLGDSSKLQVGDFCLAVGNPFGLAQTVTSGIISATGRGGLGIEALEDFIQTDAAINPGNSGGALVDVNGELVGINTAILSSGGGGSEGGSEGIGFAIPVNMAKQVMSQIIRTGKVTRAWMGVYPQEMTPTLAKAFGMQQASGILLGQVEQNSPAAKAGLQTGDVLLAMNGQPIPDVNAFRIQIGMMKPGADVKFRVRRNGSERDVTVRLGTMPSQESQAKPQAPPVVSPLSGVQVDDLTPQIARELKLPANTQGVVVLRVSPASPASDAGLSRGDVIESVNRKPVHSVREFESAVRAAGKNTALLLVNTQGTTHFLAVKPE